MSTEQAESIAEAAALASDLKNIPANTGIDGKAYPPMTAKTQAFAILTAAGMEPTVAYATLTGKKNVTKSDTRHMEKKSKSFVLAQPRRVRSAAAVIDETMSMKPQVVDIEGKRTVVIPTISNRLDAAKQVLDRADVIPQVHLSIEYSPLEMAEFELIPASKVIDQVAETVISEEDQEVTI